MDACARGGTLAALTLSLLPSWPDLPDAMRTEIESEVITYVNRQVRRMPLFLRLPFLVVLRVFALGAWMRHGRPFARLGADRRRSWVRVWAQSPLVPMRDFVRMVRSCALLAWFDHPLVIAALGPAQREPHL